MATAIELITRALRMGRVIANDQTPAAEESNDALTMLNWMLDQWWISSLAVYTVRKETWTWSANSPSWSIGPTGTKVADRPPKVVPGSFLTYQGVDYPVALLTNVEQYDRIANKTVGGIPQYLYYDPQYPDGIVYLYPVPSQAMVMTLTTYQRIETVPSLVSTLDMPPAYEMAVVTNLARRLCGEYGVEPRPSLIDEAKSSLALIKRNNLQPMTMSFDPIASAYVRNIP